MRYAVVFAAVVLALSSGVAAPATGSALAAPTATVQLRVATQNIFYGGDELDLHTGSWCHRKAGCPETLAQVVEAIRASTADIVGLEEGEHSTTLIAQALGWYASERTQVISRFPIIDPPGAEGIYVYVEAAPGRVVAIANVHLPAEPYGPYELRDGASEDEVLALERATRVPALADQLRVLPGLAAAGIPVFLMGDFNTPSHLDWTVAVAAVRPDVPFAVEWPVSRTLTDAGFRDSYREVHPDPLAVPGHTWTPGGPESETPEIHDRIDWVLATGPASALASSVVGEVGGPDVIYSVDPWPTDHRGVVSTFSVVPATPEPTVAVERRRVFVGEELGVRYHAGAGLGQRVAIVPAGASAASAVASRAVGPPGAVDGMAAFATTGLAPGAYDAVLLDGPDSVVSRSPFWLYAPGTPTTVTTSKQTYVLGEPIDVSWAGAPGMRWDWLAIYTPGTSDESRKSQACTSGCANNGRYLMYVYTRTAIEGTARFDASAVPGTYAWPLKPGSYEIRLLVDDSYRSAGSSATFKVVKP
jgi:endonuclease/exonuclease/phosphatase family metal-dependent hydrolase